MQKHIPNLITLLNISAGFLSIICIIEGYILYACYLIMVASVLDFFDGFIAKLLNAQSELGKQLDSFSDLVSFGIAPASLTYVFLGELQAPEIPTQMGYLKLLVLFLPVFSVLRLAKFNLDDRQKNEFIGLPTPANALFFASAIASLSQMDSLFKIAFLDFYMLISLVVIFSLLLVTNIQFFSLKFSNFNWKENKTRYVFIFSAILLFLGSFLIGNLVVSVSIIILLYIFLSMLNYLFKRNEI